MKKNAVPVNRVIILVLIAGLLGGCSGPRNNDILLQIGSWQLTPADYALARNSPAFKALTDEQLQHKLVEEGRILAYALDHKYDTIGLLTRQLNYAVRYYASKVDGYVWNKEVKPLLNVTAVDIREAYARRSDEYRLECIHFRDEGQLKKYYTAESPLPSREAFYAVKKKTASDPRVTFYSHFYRYPFFPLGVYIPDLTRANTGDVRGPFETLNGYYLVHIAEKRVITPPPWQQEQFVIREELLNSLKEKYIWESQRTIFSETNPRMHEAAIADMVSKVNAIERKWPGVQPGMVLMEYDLGGAHRLYTVADFIEFVRCEPVFSGSLSDTADVKNMLRSWLIGMYLFAKAQQMNMEMDQDYQLFRKQCRNNIFGQHYKQQNIYPHIHIREDEMESYYRAHQKELTCFGSAMVAMYAYPDMQSAFEGRNLVIDQYRKINRAPNAGLQEIRVKDTLYSKAIIDAISRSAPGEVSMPISNNGNYLVVHLASKSGTAVMPYKYAKEEIRKLLFLKKENSLMAALATKYPIIVNHIKEQHTINR